MKINIQLKIAGLIAIPLFAFVTLGALHIYENWKQFNQSQISLVRTTQFSITSKIIHLLQEERAELTLSLIGKDSPDGAKKRDFLDEKINLLIKALETKEQKNINDLKSNLGAIRKTIDSSGISGEIFEAYDREILKLIEFEVELAKQISLPGIESSLLVVNTIEHARESSAQLRTGMLPVMLANGPLSPTTLTKFEKLRSNIMINLESPLVQTKEEIHGFVNEFKDSENWQLVMLIYNSVVEKAGVGQYGVDPLGFYEAMSEVVNALDSPAKKILQKVDTTVLKASHDATVTAIALSLMILLGMIIILIVTYRFTFKLSKDLQIISSGLLDGVNVVNSASHGLKNASEGLSSSSQGQARSIESTTHSVEEIAKKVTSNADQAKESRSTFAEVLIVTEKGKKSVHDVGEAVKEIHSSSVNLTTQITENNNEITKIVGYINNIEERTKVIHDIVFQTKLLAFNASVEAARAGEQGQGFAVVAEEVGNLAQISGNAAKEISDMLTESISQVQNIVQSSQEKIDSLIEIGKDKIDIGLDRAKRCGEVLDQIATSIESVNSMVVNIATSSEEQNSGVSEISKSIHEINATTQKNLTLSNHVSQSADSLAAQAEQLNTMVMKLNEVITGNEIPPQH